ncbi:MAG: asparagine synthase (glutamine-hydrolyzing) [Pyrinomonadaceae bacterium]
MCGIAGLIGVEGDQRAAAGRLLSALRHRGPDDEGIEEVGPGLTLVHSRLSIIDLTSAGHQPMSDRPTGGQKPNWIVSNGEIFNFRVLQPELEAAGWPSHTRNDTEVILHGYRVWGESWIDRLHGMFAFGLVDTTTGLVHLVRDRLGIKPLYVYRPPSGGVVFASEMRAILALGPEYISPRVEARALEGFLAQGAIPGPRALIEGIELVKPGSCVTIDAETGKERRVRTYWQLPVPTDEGHTRAELVEEIAATARKAIAMRLISDVPLGLFLSGGVDSAALLALASEVNPEALRTISLGFDVPEFDETADAAATAAAFGTLHTSLKITGDEVMAALPEMLAVADQPTVDGMNTFIVSRAAHRAGLTVALSGMGGDELFGGYASFTDAPRALAWRKRLGWFKLSRLAANFKGTRAGAKQSEALSRPPDLLLMYLLRRELFLPGERRSLLGDTPEGCCPHSGLSETRLDELRRRAHGLDEINQVSMFELETYMRHMLLRDADVFSMAAPLEYRVPFLDHELVETVFRVPGKWKRADPRPKPMLIDVAGPRLPAAVWQKPKRGFTFPWASWLGAGGALAELARDAAHDTGTWDHLGVNPAGVQEIWTKFTAGDHRVSALQMLAFINLRDYAVRHHLRAA